MCTWFWLKPVCVVNSGFADPAFVPPTLTHMPQADLKANKADLAELKDELKAAVKREAAKVSKGCRFFCLGIVWA